MNALTWASRFLALIFAGGMFFGFAWYSGDLGIADKMFRLAPPIALSLVALLPLRVYAPGIAKTGFSLLALVAIARIGFDVWSSLTLPMGPNVGAAFMRLVCAAIVALWLWLIWAEGGGTDAPSGTQDGAKSS